MPPLAARREDIPLLFLQLIREAAGIPHEEALRVWVLMHDVPEGRWGAGGQVIRFQQLLELAKAEREQSEQAVASG